MKIIDKECNKVKYKCFGKVQIGKSVKFSQEVKALNKEKAYSLEKENQEEVVKVDEKLTLKFLQEQREDLVQLGLKSKPKSWS